MKEQFVGDVYDTLRGIRIPSAKVKGVENLFAPGAKCEQLYGQMLNAYERLCVRLGVVDEDADVETIIMSLMEIEREICMRMYQYGAEFGVK